DASRVVGSSWLMSYGDRGVSAPPLVVGRRAPGSGAHRPHREGATRELVVDAPPGVVVERLPTPGQQGVRTGPRTMKGAVPVHPVPVGEPAVEVRPFLRKEACLRHVG